MDGDGGRKEMGRGRLSVSSSNRNAEMRVGLSSGRAWGLRLSPAPWYLAQLLSRYAYRGEVGHFAGSRKSVTR